MKYKYLKKLNSYLNASYFSEHAKFTCRILINILNELSELKLWNIKANNKAYSQFSFLYRTRVIYGNNLLKKDV